MRSSLALDSVLSSRRSKMRKKIRSHLLQRLHVIDIFGNRFIAMLSPLNEVPVVVQLAQPNVQRFPFDGRLARWSRGDQQRSRKNGDKNENPSKM